MTPVSSALMALTLLLAPASAEATAPLRETEAMVASVRAAARAPRIPYARPAVSVDLPAAPPAPTSSRSPHATRDAAAIAAFEERLARVESETARSDRPDPAEADLGTFLVTCYALSGTTASGAPVSEAVVAVDPRVIPLGTSIHIEGIGVRVALDTGGKIVGRRLDIWSPSVDACRQFGAQHRQVRRA